MADEDTNVETALREAPPARLDIDVCRTMPSTPSFRAADGEGEDGETSPGTMYGHFSTFNDPYEINSWFEGNFMESIAPGAFKRTINNRGDETPVRVLLDHGFDPQLGDKPLGVPEVLEERDRGPYAEVPLFDGVPRMVVSGLRAGAYGQSFRFMVLRDEWVEEPEPSDTNPKGLPERTIKELRLIEFGPTPFPANPSADAGLRSGTDDFYARLRKRDAESYDRAVARASAVRLPEPGTKAETGDNKTEDPQTRHSEDSPTRHSEDSPGEHSAAPQHDDNTETNRSKTMANETMTVEERAARQSEIRTRLAEIDQEFSGAELSDEARAEFNELHEEHAAHQRAIDDQEERRARLAEINPESEQGRSVERPSRGPAVVRKPENIFDLSEARQQARSVDELPAIYRDRAMRAVEQARFPGVEDREAAQRHVEQLLDTVDDENGTLARKILVTGSPVYSRAFGKALMSLSTNGLSAEEQRALALGSDPAGGFAVPFQLDPTVILTSDGVMDPLRQISRVEQITGKEWHGVSSAGVTVTRSPEGTEVGENSPTFEQPKVATTRVTGFVPFSVELDSAWSQLQSEITTILNDAKASEEAGSFMNGSGTGEEPEGLITALAANAGSLVATAGVNSFAVDDVYAVEDALPPRHLANAVWLAQRSIYNRVRGFDPNGTSLWNRLGAGTPPELIGYPAYKASEMGSAINGGIFAVLGNFRRFLIVDRVGMRVELVPHLLGANGRPTGQRGILAIWDNACKVLDANAFRALNGRAV